jgi:hypothetical protein
MGHFTSKHHFGFEAAAWYWHFVGATVRLYQMNKVTSDWVTRRLSLPSLKKNRGGTTACSKSPVAKILGNSRAILALACSCEPETGVVPCRPTLYKVPERRGTSTMPKFTIYFWHYLNSRKSSLKGMLLLHMRSDMIPVNLSVTSIQIGAEAS